MTNLKVYQSAQKALKKDRMVKCRTNIKNKEIKTNQIETK